MKLKNIIFFVAGNLKEICWYYVILFVVNCAILRMLLKRATSYVVVGVEYMNFFCDLSYENEHF